MSWILFTLGAVVMQTVRNALQSKLSGAVNTSGVTLSRFILAPPIALVYLLILYSLFYCSDTVCFATSNSGHFFNGDFV